MKTYVSDFTKFLTELKQFNPHIERDQQLGRSLLWDQQPLTPEDQRRHQLSRVAKQPYEYYSFRPPHKR
jgi:Protein of unknown function (DUF3460)